MKLFKCTNCGQLIYFENTTCVQCGFPLGYLAAEQKIYAMTYHQSDNSYSLINPVNNRDYRYCSNYQYNTCNWLVEKDQSAFCSACELNGVIPDLSQPQYLQRWTAIENAKHRLVYALQCLKLPLVSKYKDPEHGLQFDFLASAGKENVLTGHDNGLITINIAEADDIEREMARRAMDEVYRTLLGHFRHEVGHYYWDRLIDNTPNIDRFRAIFGDERADYDQALKNHYKTGAPANWNADFISAYASTHPWEDWAESWAHYMHIMDTLETAYAFGISVRPFVASPSSQLDADIKSNPYQIISFDNIFHMWLPLTFAMNSLNRSMGVRDPYPFIISDKVAKKLGFIHEVCNPVGRYRN